MIFFRFFLSHFSIASRRDQRRFQGWHNDINFVRDHILVFSDLWSSICTLPLFRLALLLLVFGRPVASLSSFLSRMLRCRSRNVGGVQDFHSCGRYNYVQTNSGAKSCSMKHKLIRCELEWLSILFESRLCDQRRRRKRIANQMLLGARASTTSVTVVSNNEKRSSSKHLSSSWKIEYVLIYPRFYYHFVHTVLRNMDFDQAWSLFSLALADISNLGSRRDAACSSSSCWKDRIEFF